MDLKEPGNRIYLVGLTNNELGGSHFSLVEGLTGGSVPTVDATMAKHTFAAIHQAIRSGLVRACHDLSEGGLAVAAAEMAFAGGLGTDLLFAESNTRFLCEVTPDQHSQFEAALAGVPYAYIGETTDEPQLTIRTTRTDDPLISEDIESLKAAWQAPLRW
jgi:phosphoribosylformylglycinamidine synthase